MSTVRVHSAPLVVLLLVFSFTSLLVVGDPILESEEKQNEIVCHVSHTTFYSDPQTHYERLVSRYVSCTHIIGDLVIADLRDPNIDYDLSFLQTIRYVSGYVAIYANRYPVNVSLPNLEMIRGNQTFNSQTVKQVSNITLLLSLTNHRHVFMPSLKEVSSGNALIDLETCPNLCHLDTIDWGSILRDGYARVTETNALCPPCSQSCESDRGLHCWGPTEELCQYQQQECERYCSYGLCVTNYTSVCCSPLCALGCRGPSSYSCVACRDYTMDDGQCASYCPLWPSHVTWGVKCYSVGRLG